MCLFLANKQTKKKLAILSLAEWFQERSLKEKSHKIVLSFSATNITKRHAVTHLELSGFEPTNFNTELFMLVTER